MGGGYTAADVEAEKAEAQRERELPEKIMELRKRLAQRKLGLEEGSKEQESKLCAIYDRDDDVFLSSFLRAKKTVDRAFEAYAKFVNFILSNEDVFEGLEERPPKTDEILQFAKPLPSFDRKGRRLQTIIARNMNAENVVGMDMLRFNARMNLKAKLDETTQKNGIVIVETFEGFKFSGLKKMDKLIKPIKKKMFELLECFPVRMKGIYIINQPWYFTMIWALVRPFLKRKLKKRIKVLGSKESKLHELIIPCSLPKEFGGTLPDDAVNTVFL